MPTYQYACTNADCGNRFELVQAFTDASVSQCPVCGQRVRKVYGSVGVVFKGSGFYRNDSRSGAEKTGGEVKAATEGGESKTSDTKSTSKDSAPASTGSGAGASDSGGSSKSTDAKPDSPKSAGSKATASKAKAPAPN